jgi:hypothetical protein
MTPSIMTLSITTFTVAVKYDGTVYKINVMRRLIPSMLSVVKLSVVMLNVVAPFEHLLKNNKEQERGRIKGMPC